MSWRLNPADDFAVHQTAAPMDQPATSDRHFNDGYWFGFYTKGHYAFMGMRLHPNNNVIDGYAGLIVNGEQRCVRFSRALRPRTNDLEVGPLRFDVLEPLKRQRITLSANDQGIEWEVEMDAYGLWTEDRALQYRHGVVLNDVLRYTGVCRPSGWVSIDGERQSVADWHGARDHSWGIRSTMGPRTALGGILDEARDPRAMRLWIPFRCGDEFGFLHGHQDADGATLDFAGEIQRGDETIELVGVDHDFEYHAGSRRLKAGRYSAIDAAGGRHDYEFEVCCEGVHPQGFGYNQGWFDGGNPGEWRGPEFQESDRFDVTDPTGKPAGRHLPPNRRLGATEFAATLDGPGGAGIGMVEHMVYGAYHPAGFEGTEEQEMERRA